MWCDTLPSTPAGAAEVWQQRIDTVRNANSLTSLADPTIERWLTDAVKQQRAGRWKQIRDTIIGTTPAGYLGCVAAIRNFDFVARLPSIKLPVLVVCGAEDAGTPPAENRRIASLVPGARYEEIANALHFPNVEHPETFNRIMLGWLQSQR
jgi:3-oxoadipate enol-lactonase